jgi:hypothetical protein
MNLYVWPQQDPDDQYLLHKDYYTRLQKMETEAGESMHKTKKNESKCDTSASTFHNKDQQALLEETKKLKDNLKSVMHIAV